MSSITSNTTAKDLQSLLNFSKKNAQNGEGASFSELVNMANVQNSAITQTTQTIHRVLTGCSNDAYLAVPIFGYRVSLNSVFLDSFLPVATTTTINTTTLLNDNNLNAAPKKALISDLGELSKEQLEAIGKDLDQLDKGEQAQLFENKLKAIFFRDADTLEFGKNTLSEETIKALREEFGDESFLEREDGSLILSGKAEKFISGWQKALNEANKNNENKMELNELIQADKNFNGTLDDEELKTSQNSMTTITTTTVLYSFWIYFIPANFADNSLANLKALASGFAFSNLSAADKTSLEQNFPELFNNASKNENSDENESKFDKAKFDEYYQKLSDTFKAFSASFMNLTQNETSKLNFEKLSDIVLDMGKNISKDTQKSNNEKV